MTELDSKLGWLLVGCLASVFFFGINSYQTLSYFRSYQNDPCPQKLFVSLIWFGIVFRSLLSMWLRREHFLCRILELAHGCLAGYLSYTVFVTNFMNYENAIAEAYLKLSLTGFVSVTITAFVQWYFAFRLYKLSGSKLVPLVSAAFSLMRFICYVGAGAYRQQHHVQTPHWVWVLFTVGILSIITDILMASKLFICLWKRRENGERVNKRLFRYPFKTVDSIIIISIQANAFTCIVTTVTVILYNISDDGFAWMAMSLIASRLFAISFLSSLLSGKKLSRQTNPMAPSGFLPNELPMIFPTDQSFGETEPAFSAESSEFGTSPLRTSTRNSLVPSLGKARSEESSASSPV